MKVLSVVGARPQFVKLGPIARELRDATDIHHVIVHTGQHYDRDMSEVFFKSLRIPDPDVNLGVGSSSHGHQTGEMIAKIEDVLQRERPDWTLVYGDTNSTLAAAVAAVKLQLPVAHLEAGLRSFNRAMPEEHNRVLTDHCADLLLAPTKGAVDQLDAEGLAARTSLVGDVMTDVCLQVAAHIRTVADSASLPAAPYVLATIHRPSNTDEAGRLRLIMDSLRSIPVPVVLVAHPRLRAAADRFGIPLSGGRVEVVTPLAYPDLIAAVQSAAGVVTDSGGLQKEAFLLGVPCTTIRSETEWVETLVDGWNLLDPQLTAVAESAVRPRPSSDRGHPYGDGHAAAAVVSELRSRRPSR